jgi:hypothetical protein
MINVCNVSNKGFNVYNYDTRATANGFTHEVASGHATAKAARSVSAIHGSTNIIADHDDNRKELYVTIFSQTTGPFPKLFVTSSNVTDDMNYIEGTALIIATSYLNPFNIEIHITT